MSKKKFYVVWNGRKKGIYTSWNVCKKQIDGFESAQYKSFSTFDAAKIAYKSNYKDYIGKTKTFKSDLSAEELKKIGQPNHNSIAVDAASSGNPGKMEYRAVDTQTHQQLFYQGPFDQGTNNVGEFLALVHGLAFLSKNKSSRKIYSDSRIAIGWVKKKKCNTKLKQTSKNKKVFELLKRAENWLKNNTYTTVILKWETKAWGEIPADFGRK